MSAVDDEADLFRRIRDEEAERFERARGPVAQAEEEREKNAVQEFQERMESGWYGEPDEDDLALSRLLDQLNEEDD